MAGSNNFVGANNACLADRLAERSVENSVPYLIPVLDSLPKNFIFLDVGCGPGSITLDIARRYPVATILGIDSPDVVEKASANARAAGITNARFRAGDGLDLAAVASQPGFEAVAGGCDVVHTHQVQVHVRDAAKLMRELHAAAKPRGGLVCCREGDYGMVAFWPELPGLVCTSEGSQEIKRARGQDPHAGRKLVAHALAAGFKRENIDASLGTWLFSTPVERRAWADLIMDSFRGKDESRQGAEKAKFSGMDVRLILKDWEAWVQAEDGWYAVPCSQVVCRRGD